jgi:hypothetical protein
MRANLCRAARREIANYGRAYICTTAAAVLEQEHRDLVHVLDGKFLLPLPSIALQWPVIVWREVSDGSKKIPTPRLFFSRAVQI